MAALAVALWLSRNIRIRQLWLGSTDVGPGICYDLADAANGRNVRIAVIDRTKMLHSADNVRFGEAALRHCDRRSMSPLGRL